MAQVAEPFGVVYFTGQDSARNDNPGRDTSSRFV